MPATAAISGSLTINADGSYTYALDNTLPAVQALKSGETISDVFIYTVSDGRGQFVDATLTIVITGTNDAPLVQPDTNTIVEDSPSPVTGSVLLNDRDPDNGAVLTITGVSSGTGRQRAGRSGGQWRARQLRYLDPERQRWLQLPARQCQSGGAGAGRWRPQRIPSRMQ